MIPGRIEGANVSLGAPDDWEKARDGKCGTLHILAEPAANGALLMSSVWFPTPAELELIAAGAPVKLTVHATGHPPVMLGVGTVPV